MVAIVNPLYGHKALGLYGLCALVVLTLILHQDVSDPAGSYNLSAKFRSVEGLEPQASVTMAGLPVGHVQRMTLSPDDFSARVFMVIKLGVAIPEDSAVAVVSQGMFGGKFLRITPGGSLENLQDGQTMNYVQNSVNMRRILQQIIAAAEAE